MTTQILNDRTAQNFEDVFNWHVGLHSEPYKTEWLTLSRLATDAAGSELTAAPSEFSDTVLLTEILASCESTTRYSSRIGLSEESGLAEEKSVKGTTISKKHLFFTYVGNRTRAEVRFFTNTLIEAILHPFSTSVIDKQTGRVVARGSGKP